MYYFDYRAEFVVSDGVIDLTKYVDLLSGLPFEQIRKGEERYGKFGNKLNRKVSLSCLKWRLHTEEEVSSEQKRLDEVVLAFIGQIDNQKILFQELRGIGVEMAIEIASRPQDSYSVLRLSPKLTEDISRHGIELNLYFVVPPGRLY